MSIDSLRGMDIYLIDQILKGRYVAGQRILDAGCGSGRNLTWFMANGIEIHGCDRDEHAINELHTRYPDLKERFFLAGLDHLPYPNQHFDHIICSAVLHFSENEDVFLHRMKGLTRVLKRGGTLFIRMATLQGLPKLPKALGSGRYLLLDDSERFLLTPELLDELLFQNSLDFIEAPKAVNVNDLRSMGVLLLQRS